MFHMSPDTLFEIDTASHYLLTYKKSRKYVIIRDTILNGDYISKKLDKNYKIKLHSFFQ